MTKRELQCCPLESGRGRAVPEAFDVAIHSVGIVEARLPYDAAVQKRVGRAEGSKVVGSCTAAGQQGPTVCEHSKAKAVPCSPSISKYPYLSAFAFRVQVSAAPAKSRE